MNKCILYRVAMMSSLLILLGCKKYLSVEVYSSYNGAVLPEKIQVIDSAGKYDALLMTTMDHLGLKNIDIQVKTTDEHGVFSVINRLDYTRSIRYNVSFLDSVYTLFGTDLGIKSICFHEMAHQIYHHPLKNTILSQAYELQADRYSGFEMCVIGASLEQSLLAMRVFGNSHLSSTHPDKERRLKEITKGYYEARIEVFKDLTYKKRLDTMAYDDSVKAVKHLGSDTSKMLESFRRANGHFQSKWPVAITKIDAMYDFLGHDIYFTDKDQVRSAANNQVVGYIRRSDNKLINDIIDIQGVLYYLNHDTNQIICINPDGTKMTVGKKKWIPHIDIQPIHKKTRLNPK